MNVVKIFGSVSMKLNLYHSVPAMKYLREQGSGVNYVVWRRVMRITKSDFLYMSITLRRDPRAGVMT